MSPHAPLPHPYGFDWGPMRVTRIAMGPDGQRILRIATGNRVLEVAVSAKGNSIRAWLDGVPMTKFGGAS